MTVPAAISLVTLGVRDIVRSTRFYGALGFPLSPASVAGEVSFFRTRGGLLGLYGTDALAADIGIDAPSTGGFPGVTLAINVAAPDEVDAALRTAMSAGAHILKQPQATEWGGYHGYFADPDGHAWEVAHNPFWPLGEDGLPQLP